MSTIEIDAPELRRSSENRRALYARTPTGIVIGGSWMRKSTPWEAQALSGPHRPASRISRLGDRVLYRLAVPLGLIVVIALLAAERFA